MNFKLTSSFLFFLLVLTSCGLVFSLMRPQTTSKSAPISQSETRQEDVETDLKVAFWNTYPTLVIPNDGKRISESVLLKDIAGKSFPLGELIRGESKLIFRYSYIDCGVCIDSVISQIQEITKLDKLDDLIIITDSYSDRDFVIKNKRNDHPYPVYNISNSNLGISLEGKNLPFLFVVDSELRASKFFIPIKEVPYQTEQYLAYIFEFLGDSKK